MKMDYAYAGNCNIVMGNFKFEYFGGVNYG